MALLLSFPGTMATALELPVIIAHRGASAVTPENTRSAIEEACRMGAKVIEFDVRQTKDGELVLFHDDKLERLVGREGAIESMNWDSIRDLDVGAWFGAGFEGEKPIRLADAIELCRAGNAIALIEHKTGDAERYAAVIRSLDAAGDVIVQSFQWDFLSAFREEMKDVPIGALGSKEISSSKLARLKTIAPDWVGWKFSDLSGTNLTTLQELGFRVALWTVNESKEAAKWIERGVDAIITDHPDKMIPLVESE